MIGQEEPSSTESLKEAASFSALQLVCMASTEERNFPELAFGYTSDNRPILVITQHHALYHPPFMGTHNYPTRLFVPGAYSTVQIGK